MMQRVCLSIAGFDGSGGAGIQADLKTFAALGCYGVTVLTALPVQNTCGVRRCYPLPLSCIEEQLIAIFEDIMPDCIKIGMLFSAPVVACVAQCITQYASHIPLILDPVMVAKSGDPLLQPEAIEALKTLLIPHATLITPNLPEADTLIGNTQFPPEIVAAQLLALGPKAVLLKGGHANNHEYANDLFVDSTGQMTWLTAPRIDSQHTHGTGCTLSAAICANTARGLPLLEACSTAKHYLTGAIAAAKDHPIGKGQGPVHHFYQHHS